MIGERRRHQVRRFSIPLFFYLSIHRYPYPHSCKIPDVSYPRSRHLPPLRVNVDTDQNGKRLSSKKNKVGAALGHHVPISERIPLLNLPPFSPSFLHFSPHDPFFLGVVQPQKRQIHSRPPHFRGPPREGPRGRLPQFIRVAKWAGRRPRITPPTILTPPTHGMIAMVLTNTP
jgi:hypothetical protein